MIRHILNMGCLAACRPCLWWGKITTEWGNQLPTETSSSEVSLIKEWQRAGEYLMRKNTYTSFYFLQLSPIGLFLSFMGATVGEGKHTPGHEVFLSRPVAATSKQTQMA